MNSNYRVVITSNSGTSSFNGEATIEASGNVKFGVGSVSASGKVNGSIQRKSEFTRYKTYIVEENVNVEVRPIKVKTLKDLIQSLQMDLNEIENI